MVKQPRPRNTSQDNEHAPEPGYAIGYGRPPAHSRFKPGQSGNSKGRAKYSRNLRTIVEEVLQQRIVIREGQRSSAAKPAARFC